MFFSQSVSSIWREWSSLLPPWRLLSSLAFLCWFYADYKCFNVMRNSVDSMGHQGLYRSFGRTNAGAERTIWLEYGMMEYGRITKMFRFWVVLSQQQRPQQRQQQQMNSGAICTFTRQWFGSRAGCSQTNGFQASRSPTYVSQVEPTAAAATTPKYADICWRICWVAELPGDWVEWIIMDVD